MKMPDDEVFIEKLSNHHDEGLSNDEVCLQVFFYIKQQKKKKSPINLYII